MLQALHLRETEEQLISAVYYASPASYAINAPGLRSIPPERVGLRGEYDYYGLAHRIQARFHDYMGKSESADIVVNQRGSAVILTGSISKAEVLNDLVVLAMSTDGVTQVEVYNMAIQPQQGLNVA